MSLDQRLNALRKAQNADGGWPYFAGKQSWLEPTAWAALALHGDPAADRAWNLLRSWQIPDGSWRPSADVQISNWGTALCVTIACVRGEFDDSFRRGVAWLLGSYGIGSVSPKEPIVKSGLFSGGRNPKPRGWPWKPNASSSIEPTAISLLALKKSAAHFEDAELKNRIASGHAELMELCGADFGWNEAANDLDASSDPQATGLALVGLQRAGDVSKSIARAKQLAAETRSPMGRAWLRIALQLHKEHAPPLADTSSPDLMVKALEALSFANYKFLRTGDEA